jgi:hypothetical protein
VAFDWIESHRGLKDHPKTVTLAATWADRKTCVVGHLHDLWWWTLEYAPSGVIRPEFFPQVVAYCEWHGAADRFWSGLLQVGFLEAPSGVDGAYVVHDWDVYAIRRLQRLDKDAQRKRTVRASSGGQSARSSPDKAPLSGGLSAGHGVVSAGHGAGHLARAPDDHTGPHQPDTGGPSPCVPDLPDPRSLNADADAQGPTGTASARKPTPRELGTNPRVLGTNPRALGTNPRALAEPPPPTWEEVAPGQFQGTPDGQGEVTLLKVRCPRCERSMFVDEFDEHPCELVLSEPIQAPPRRRAGRGFQRLFEPPESVPPEVRAELERMERERPTPEQIAAEVARIGLQPRSEA